MTSSDQLFLPIPQLPQCHGLTTNTFRLPVLDGSLTFGEICDFHLTNSPDHPAFVYGTGTEIPWKDFVPAIHRAGRYFIETFGIDTSAIEIPTVGILATTDSFTFAAVALGIVRAECSAFFISTRNSPAAVAHLLTMTKTKYLFGTKEMSLVIDAALGILETSGQEKPKVSMIPTFSQLFNHDEYKLLPPIKRTTIKDVAFIIHSSGSTAFPKPIPWSHYALILGGRSTGHGIMDFANLRFSGHAIPIFHGLGMTLLVFAAMAGTTLAFNDPNTPPAPPNQDSVYAGAVNTKCDLIMSVPIFIEAWLKDPRRVEYLSTIKAVLFGGGPLNKGVGDALTKKGVNIYQIFASSEGGPISVLFPEPPELDWEYFPMSPHVKFEMIPHDTGTYELILLRGQVYTPAVFNTNINGVDGYATSDLFVPHPTREGYWRLFGRADDQLMHNSGEKTNPGPLEAILARDPHVKSAIMFGQGRFNSGVIIEPTPQHAFDPSHTEKLAEFRTKIWPTVEKMNDYAPQHSRLFKEMILVALPSKPFEYTLKGAPRRPAIIAQYEPEIEAVYEAVQESAQAASVLPDEWTPASTLNFVQSVVGNVLKETVTDDSDLFQHGCDSLQATWIRNSILHALRKTTELDTRALDSGFVYRNPTILGLTGFILDLMSSSPLASGRTSQADKVEEMLNLVAKYSRDFVVHQGSVAAPAADTVLVTGTTGAIGSAVLAELVKTLKVDRIFAFNRKGKTGLAERQKKAFEDRGLDPLLVDAPKIVLVEANLAQPNFGVNEELFEEIRSSVTHIIHIAWRVDFNLSLQSFEHSLQGLSNLINFSLSSPLSSPPRLHFTSSIAVLRGYSKAGVPEMLVDPETAVGSGYGESKWVSEKIISLAGLNTVLRPTIVRIGQVSGGANGSWNPLEWLPSIAQSAALVKCLPTMNQDLSLIPLDLVGTVIVELRDFSAEVVHLAHPKLVRWDFVLGYMAKMLGVPMVPYAQWLERLEATESENAVKLNSALRLLEFYRSIKQTGGPDDVPFHTLRTDLSESASPALRCAHAIKERDIQRWLDYWKAARAIAF